MTTFAGICLALIVARWLAQLWLERINDRHVEEHGKEIPEAFRDVTTPENYAKAVAYTLEKSKLEKIELTWGAVVLIAALFSGALPWLFAKFPAHSIWAGAAFIFTAGFALS